MLKKASVKQFIYVIVHGIMLHESLKKMLQRIEIDDSLSF